MVPSSPLFGLKIGATGDAVRQLQATLVAHGFKTKGDADGTFGVNTVNALSSFQYEKRIKVNGRVDEATLAALGTPAPVPAAAPAAAPAVVPSSPLFGLKIGATGDAVRQLQATLVAHGFKTKGDADGTFGVNTVNALSSFQYEKRIKVNGRVDEATLAALGTPAPVPAAAPAAAPAAGGGLGFATYGERGGRVATLQHALINAGITVRGGADGIFGSGTAAGVLAFQKAKGIKATGVVDQATAQALGLTPGAAPAVPGPRVVHAAGVPGAGQVLLRRYMARARAAPVGCTKASTSAPPRARTCTQSETVGSRSSTWSAPTSSPATA